jgi:hypothetical protein
VNIEARETGLAGQSGEAKETFSQDAQNARPARPQPKNRPEAYPLGYVEDLFEGRTPLAGIFSILPLRIFVAQ